MWGEEALASSNTTDREQKLLSEHNALLAFQFEFMRTVHEQNEKEVKPLATFENPANALLWQFEEFSTDEYSIDTAEDEQWTDVDYLACHWGSVRAKKQRLRTNLHTAATALALPSTAAGLQCHDHQHDEWRPWKDNDGKWVYPSAAEREYPARFVWQMAVAISCETAKRFKYKLSVPRSPAMQPLMGGSREWWLELPANAVSYYSIVAVGMQLFLKPPSSEGHIPPVVCGSFLKDLPPGAVCCS